jgi:prepilin-type N-terminal cleavage/methylation domain-containing protein
MVKNNKRGFTIVEVLVTSIIGVVTAGVIASYISFLAKMNHEMKIRRIAGNVVHSISESIRFNLSLFQVTFDNSVDKENSILLPANLPLGISNSTLVQRSECAVVLCQAYLGYIIVPSDIVRNLYQVKFRVVSIDAEAKWKVEFTYFITVK